MLILSMFLGMIMVERPWHYWALIGAQVASLWAFAAAVRIPSDADHRFRRKPITHFDPSRSPIPSQVDHLIDRSG